MGKLLKRILRLAGFGDFRAWRGVNKQGSPAAIGPDQLRDLENVLWSGGALLERGGQSKVNAAALAGSGVINGIYDSSFGAGSVGGWGGGGGGGGIPSGGGSIPPQTGNCPALLPTIGDGIKIYSGNPGGTGVGFRYASGYYDEEKYPSGTFFPLNVFPINDVPPGHPFYQNNTMIHLTVYNSEIFSVGSNPGGTKVFGGSMPPAYGNVSPVARKIFEITPTWTIDSLWYPSQVVTWNGALYFVVCDKAQPPRIYKWDGTTVSLYYTSDIVPAANNYVSGFIATYGSSLYLSYAHDTVHGAAFYANKLTNASTGVSTNFGDSNNGSGIESVGGFSFPSYACMTEYKGKLYIGGGRNFAGGGARVYSWDGTNLVVARDLAVTVGVTPGGQEFFSGATNLWVYKGILYYHYNTAKLNGGSNNDWRIGKFDGTTWTDSFLYPILPATPTAGLTGLPVVFYKGKVAFSIGVRSFMTTDFVTLTEFAIAVANPNSCPTHDLFGVCVVL